jgi:hypothetical protein
MSPSNHLCRARFTYLLDLVSVRTSPRVAFVIMEPNALQNAVEAAYDPVLAEHGK